MTKKFKKIFVNSLGSFNLNLPVLLIGQGKPRVSLVIGLHGNETSGLFVVEELLKNITLKKGSLSIVLAANPLAQLLQIRHNPIDLNDLNRVFPGSVDGTSSAQIAKKLIEFLRGSELVIDLHAFTAHAPLFGIMFRHGTPKAQQQAKKFLRLFNPEIIWQLDANKPHEHRLRKGLGIELMRLGIPNFAIELQDPDILPNEMVNRTIQGIKRILRHLDMADVALSAPKSKIPIFERFVIKAINSGLFHPNKDLILKKIAANFPIASITTLPSFKTAVISSPKTGILLEIRRKGIVQSSDKLFSLGHKVGDL